MGIVGDFGCSRGELNRDHLVAVLAPKETDILHVPDAGDAPGITEATRRTGLQETAEASLVKGLCHRRTAGSSLTGCVPPRVPVSASGRSRVSARFQGITFKGVKQGLDTRQTCGEEFSLHRQCGGG